MLGEDDRTNKTLTIAFELRPGAVAPNDVDSLTHDFLERLAAANQDYRESRKMVPQGLLPRLKFYDHGTGPFEGKDIRLKSKYIQTEKK